MGSGRQWSRRNFISFSFSPVGGGGSSIEGFTKVATFLKLQPYSLFHRMADQ